MADNVQKWWDIETTLKVQRKKSVEEEHEAQKILEKTTKFTGERFEVGMLWSEDDPKLPNNYGAALGQLFSLEKDYSGTRS